MVPKQQSSDKPYKPSDDEPYMNPDQLAYFRQKLEDWRDEILKESHETLHHLQEDATQMQSETDDLDKASIETSHAIELRTRDRERKLLRKLEQALKRIEDGTYGYCEVTGEPIGLKRLEANPRATMTLEAQEDHEREEKLHKDS